MYNNSQTIIKYIDEVKTILATLQTTKISQVVSVLEEAREKGRGIYTFGNGGSAANASHFASDLAKGAICPGQNRLKAFSLNSNSSLISAWANDLGYENVFAEQLENFIEKDDIAIGISGSGNSLNVLNGIKIAKNIGAITIGFTGFNGGRLKELVDIDVIVPSHNMEQVEDIHLLLSHIIATCLRSSTLTDLAPITLYRR